jgi:hypothetical protein
MLNRNFYLKANFIKLIIQRFSAVFSTILHEGNDVFALDDTN